MTQSQRTPAEWAEAALRNSYQMCRLTAAAKHSGAPHTWAGSAYRAHPCGMAVDTILVTNYWRVGDSCDIQLTDGAGWDRHNISRDPCATGGSPYPKPVGGTAITVWRDGQWLKPEYAKLLTTRLLEILTAAAEHVLRCEQSAQAKSAEAHASEQERWKAAERKALAIVTGSHV